MLTVTMVATMTVQLAAAMAATAPAATAATMATMARTMLTPTMAITMTRQMPLSDAHDEDEDDRAMLSVWAMNTRVMSSAMSGGDDAQ